MGLPNSNLAFEDAKRRKNISEGKSQPYLESDAFQYDPILYRQEPTRSPPVVISNETEYKSSSSNAFPVWVMMFFVVYFFCKYIGL